MPLYITKGKIQQNDITMANIYVPNDGTPKFIKQIVGSKEMAPSIHCLLYNHVDMSWKPRTHIKQPSTMACLCNFSTGETDRQTHRACWPSRLS